MTWISTTSEEKWRRPQVSNYAHLVGFISQQQANKFHLYFVISLHFRLYLILGKDEVGSSNLPNSSSANPQNNVKAFVLRVFYFTFSWTIVACFSGFGCKSLHKPTKSYIIYACQAGIKKKAAGRPGLGLPAALLSFRLRKSTARTVCSQVSFMFRSCPADPAPEKMVPALMTP